MTQEQVAEAEAFELYREKPGDGDPAPYYRVELSANGDPGCTHCGHGQYWTVVYDENGPTEIGTAWGDKETAEDICELMNMAYDAGRESRS